MRSLQFDLPDANLSELKRITGLIRQCASPDMIVLYGRYAGGTLASALGGYELLLLTAKNPPAATEGVMRFLCEFFPCEQRVERYLAVQSHAIGLVTDLLPRSYFFYKVYQEGVMLYDNGVCRFPRQVRFKPALVFKRAVSDAERCLGLGSGFLNEAHRQLDAQQLRLAAFGLFHGLRQFLMAVAWVHLGFLPGADNLTALFCCLRHRSAALNRELDIGVPENKRLLRRMYRLCNRQAYFGQRFEMEVSELAGYLDRLQSVRLVVSAECTDRITFYDRLRFD